MPCSTVKWKSEEAKQADRYLSVSVYLSVSLVFFGAGGGEQCVYCMYVL